MSDAATRARELLDKATPGPWRGEWVPDDDWIAVYGQPHGVYVCPEVCTLTDTADAELIAAAPTLLAELADEVDRVAVSIQMIDRDTLAEVIGWAIYGRVASAPATSRLAADAVLAALPELMGGAR